MVLLKLPAIVSQVRHFMDYRFLPVVIWDTPLLPRPHRQLTRPRERHPDLVVFGLLVHHLEDCLLAVGHVALGGIMGKERNE